MLGREGETAALLVYDSYFTKHLCFKVVSANDLCFNRVSADPFHSISFCVLVLVCISQWFVF